MLSELHIRDFAIIDQADLEFHVGMTVLTGETGAGKSILVDALGLVLGDRADSGAIRHGAERAEIQAGFDLTRLPAVEAWLEEHELAAQGECLLRRVITREGRSKAFVNGARAPLQALRELGGMLVDIHGQQAHQSLVQRRTQRALLDHHGGHSELLTELRERLHEWQARRSERQLLVAEGDEYEARLDLLRHNVAELQALALGADELADIEQEHRRLANVGSLLEAVQTALSVLSENEPSAETLLGQASRTLSRLDGVDTTLDAARELLTGAEIQMGEALAALNRYSEALEAEPDRMAQLEGRLAGIHDLARKHRIEPAELPEHAVRLAQELELLESAGAHAVELDERLNKASAAYRMCAGKLSASRAQAARTLAAQVSEVMGELGMPGGQLVITVDHDAEASPSAQGTDLVEFQVSTNAGQPPGPLARVASGGELARIGLAIQVVAADAATISCMVFDEVDSGIGGGVAEIVGRRLRDLGKHRQVLAVTHLPQVASQAHRHLLVAKSVRGKATRTTIESLDEEGRIDELARMLGGVEITRRTREHASEMIRRAQA